jgi:ribonuclease R
VQKLSLKACISKNICYSESMKNTHGNKYGFKKSPNSENKSEKKALLEGVIKTNSRKTGYIDFVDKKSVFFPEENLNTALAGDTVLFSVSKERDRRSGLKIARIEKIVERDKTNLVGTLSLKDGNWFVKPDDNRIYAEILVIGKDPQYTEGTKVFISFNWEQNSKYPEGKVERIIGKAGQHETEMQSIILEKGFDSEFPAEVERNAEEVKKTKGTITDKDVSERRDMRDVFTTTVDPADAKDFDDALSLKDLGNGKYEIGIHIADVSFFVTPNSELDKEAIKRQFSVYLVDRTIPMLPEILSNDLCSLNANEDKRAFSAVFEIDTEGKVHSEWFGRTLINSDKRFAYEDAQKSIEDPEGEFHKELTTFNKIAYKLREEKLRNGAIDFETDEVKFILDDEGKPIKVIKKHRKDAHKMIEDFMLLANRRVARFLTQDKNKSKKNVLYRIHDFPKAEKIEDLSVFLKALGHELEIKDGKVTNKSVQKLIKDISGKPQEALIKTAVLRSMSKAIYATENIGHYGLGFEFYTHFTSPIRRYPDLVIHRLLQKHLDGVPVNSSELSFLTTVSNKASQKEIAAAKAERESIKYKQVEYMSEHIGETFKATVSGVTEWGIFVEEVETKSEGLIRMRDLGTQYFELNPKTYSVESKDKKITFSLGDPITVTLVKADRENNTLDFKLAEVKK